MVAEQVAEALQYRTPQFGLVAREEPTGDRPGYDHVLTTDDELAEPEERQQVVPPGEEHRRVLDVLGALIVLHPEHPGAFDPHGEVDVQNDDRGDGHECLEEKIR